MTTVAVLQPGYLPWMGFFDQMVRSDVFVYYDTVQFDKSGWRNRNRIKTPAGPAWLTVPVLQKGRFGQILREVEIDRRLPWARKHIATIRQNYAHAPYLADCLPALERLLEQPWRWLIDLDMAVIDLMRSWFGIGTRVACCSELGIVGERSERLVEICRHFGADRYLSGDAARDYLDAPCFAAAGIAVAWQSYRHPVYPQQHGEFVPYLSALDMAVNLGPEAARLFKGVS